MRIACSISSLYLMRRPHGGGSKQLKGASPGRNLPAGHIPLAPQEETPHAASYVPLDPLASTAGPIRPGLHPAEAAVRR